MQTAHISFENLKRGFGLAEVLQGVNLQVQRGEILGLLGVNGAGKTTLLRCLLGLLKPDQGKIFFSGKKLEAHTVREDFGFLPENFFPPRTLKGADFLNAMAWGLGASKQEPLRLLNLVGLNAHLNKPIRAYSRGMIQRLGLACALLRDPAVIILDEPTLGLDPLGQKQMLDLLIALNKQGKTVFFSSHTLSQIEKVCTRVAVLDKGLISYCGPVGEFQDKYQVQSLEEAFLREIAVKE